MRIRTWIGILVAMFIFTGCASVRQITSGVKWDDNSLFLIKKGQTTAKEVAYGFGAPQKEIAGINGRIWIYYYDNGKYLFDGNAQRGMVEGEHFGLTVWFDAEGIVTDCNLSYSRYENPETKRIAEVIEKRGL